MIECNDSLVLCGKEINVCLRESLNQDNKFTTNHLRCNGRLTIDKNTYYFDYQFNPKVRTPTAKDVLECLLCDASSYDCFSDIDDFSAEFGYKISEAIRAYDECKKVSEFFHKVFTEEEYEKLFDFINNDWEEERE